MTRKRTLVRLRRLRESLLNTIGYRPRPTMIQEMRRAWR